MSSVSAAVRAHITEQGSGRPVLVLHGGGGPSTVAPLSAHFAPSNHVLAPTHPGWDGTDRPEELDSVRMLAAEYLDLIVDRGLHGTVLIGSSIGGWIAAEIAVLAAERGATDILGAVIVIDGTGIDVPDAPAADFVALDARQRAEVAWHDADLGYRDPATLSDDERAVLAGNAAAMAAIAGRPDAELPDRLGMIGVPTLVLWGASDGVVTPAYGRAYADLVPGARFVQIAEAGHLPHLERAQETFAAIDAFLAAV
jgi:pimeloyl-ACP methyl ester carboxylesterase